MSFLTPPNFSRPAGEAGPLMAAATNFQWLSDDAGNKATELAYSVAMIPGWVGFAHQAALDTSLDIALQTRKFSDVLRDASTITSRLAEQIAQAQSDVQSAQTKAYEIAQWAMGVVNPVYGIFRDVTGMADSAASRAEEAKRVAAAGYMSLIEQAPHYVPPPTPPMSEHTERGMFSTIAHATLDVVGLIPVVGEVADGVNALYYLYEKDYVNAALSAAAMVPLVGYGANAVKLGKAAKGVSGARVVRAGRHVDDLGIPHLPATTPRLNSADRVPPIDPTPPFGSRLPNREQTTPPRRERGPGVPDTPVRRPNTGYDPKPVDTGRDPLLDAIRDNAARNPRPNTGGRGSSGATSGARGAVDDAARGASNVPPPRQSATDASRGATTGPGAGSAVADAGHGAAAIPRPVQPARDASTGAGNVAAGAVPTTTAPVVPTPGAAISDAQNGALIQAGGWKEGPRLPSVLNQAATANGVAPYSQVWSVTDFRTTQTEQFVRVYVGDNTAGRWMVRKEDIVGLTPAQVMDRLALPVPANAGPLMIQTVTVPPGTRMRLSVVGSHNNVPHNGLTFNGLGDIRFGNQYEVFDHLEGAFGPGQQIGAVVQ
ncbi:MAG: hypothetical protein AB7L17_19205 [Ilumatobacteraceae bacterium]